MAETKADSVKSARKESNSRVQLEQTTTSKIHTIKKKSAQDYAVWYRGLLASTAAEALKLEINAANQRYDSEIESFKEARNEQLKILAKSLQSHKISQIEYNKRVSELSKNTSKKIASIQEEQRNSNLSKELAVEQKLIDTKISGITKLTNSIKANTDLSLQEQQSRAETAKQWAEEVVEAKKAQIERLQNIHAEQEARMESSVLSAREKEAARTLNEQVKKQLEDAEEAFQSALRISDEAEKSLEIIADKKSEILAKNIQRLSDMGDESARNLAIEYAKTLEEERENVLSQIEEKKVQVRMTLEGEEFERAMRKLDEEAAAQNKKIDSQLSEIEHLLPSQDEKDVDDYLKSFIEAEEKDRKEKQKNKAILGNAEARKKALDSQLKDALRDMANQLANMVDQKIDSFYENQAKINARLQGADTNYQKALLKISQNVSLSPFVSQNKVIEKLNTLVDSGVAYNLELRAYLGTISEKIASTFDAFDSNLLRLIKVQQADTTAARLGMEAALTRLFNSYFSDTSYLSSLADTVSQQLIEANSQLTRDMSLAFEYTVQKWLGSLYSVGFSDQGISLIADAINSLGSGNVEALSSNENAMNLVAMSASRIGLNIGEILNNGLDSNTTNQLLCSMVEYLQEIARNSKDNQVAKNALAGVFGLTMSDIRSVTNLTGLDINKILFENEIKNYETATSELESQMNMLFDREHISNMVSTLIDNLYTTAATGIGGNALSYGLWKAVGLLKDSTGGINIPSIMAAGFGVDLNADVLQLIQAGMMGLPVITSIVNQIGSAFHEGNGGSEFDKWGFTEFTPRGSAIKGITGGATSGKSSSISLGIGSNSALDLENTTLQNEVDRAEEKDKIINQHSDLRENQLNDALFTEDTDVITQLIEINEKLDSLQAISAAVQSMAVPELESGTSLESSTTGTPVDPVTGNKPSDGGIISPPTGTSSTNTSTSVGGGPQQSSSVSNTQATGVEELPEMMEAIYGEVVDFHKDFLSRTQPQTFDNTNVSNRLVRPFNDKQLHMLAQQSQAIQNLETTLSTYDIDTISKLMAETAVSASYLKEEAIHKKDEYKNNTKTNMNVSITEMSPEVTSFLAATIKTMVSSALVGEQSVDDTSTSLLQAITNALTTSNLNVKVTNDNFDTALQKYAFMN